MMNVNINHPFGSYSEMGDFLFALIPVIQEGKHLQYQRNCCNYYTYDSK